MNILESLKDKLLVADGAFGTCYAGMYGERGTVAPELANGPVFAYNGGR